jgi:hypothetical protein
MLYKIFMKIVQKVLPVISTGKLEKYWKPWLRSKRKDWIAQNQDQDWIAQNQDQDWIAQNQDQDWIAQNQDPCDSHSKWLLGLKKLLIKTCIFYFTVKIGYQYREWN